MRYLPILLVLFISCTSNVEQKAYDICNCYSQVSHTYGLKPDSVKMTNTEYRAYLQNKFADSCNSLYMEALSGISNDTEKSEFFNAYRFCQSMLTSFLKLTIVTSKGVYFGYI